MGQPGFPRAPMLTETLKNQKTKLTFLPDSDFQMSLEGKFFLAGGLCARCLDTKRNVKAWAQFYKQSLFWILKVGHRGPSSAPKLHSCGGIQAGSRQRLKSRDSQRTQWIYYSQRAGRKESLPQHQLSLVRAELASRQCEICFLLYYFFLRQLFL